MLMHSHTLKFICKVKQKYQQLKSVIRKVKKRFYSDVCSVERIHDFFSLLPPLKQTSQCLLKLFGLLLQAVLLNTSYIKEQNLM